MPQFPSSRADLFPILRSWIQEYGHIHGVDVENWGLECRDHYCIVTRIPTFDEAAGLGRWLAIKDEPENRILHPTADGPYWTLLTRIHVDED